MGVGLPLLRMELHQLECALWCKEALGYGTNYVTIAGQVANLSVKPVPALQLCKHRRCLASGAPPP